jgi:hypothetical protein
MPAQNLVWFAVVVFLVTVLYRKLMGPGWAAGLAGLLFLLDYNTCFPVAFVATPEEIAKNSAREAEVIEALQDFLAKPSVDVPFSHRTPAGTHLKYVEQLIHSIPRRE